ncbi:MAG: hypothetical protein AB7N91_28625 [Candidatus Tectimicrobiota bacterium]
MYTVPDVEQVIAVARGLGIHLGSDEAVLYQKYLQEQLAASGAGMRVRRLSLL